MRRLFACAISALVISGCDRPADPVGPEDPLEGRTASADQIVDLGTLGGSWAVAMDINNRGEVVGVSETATGAARVFIWTRRNGMTALAGMEESASAVAINNHGQVVGRKGIGAFLWSPGGVIQEFSAIPEPLPVRPNDYSYFPTDLNDNGQVLLMNGTFAYVWSNDHAPQWVMCADEWNLAYGINNRGQVVGESDLGRAVEWENPTSGAHSGYDFRLGFVWDPDTRHCRRIQTADWAATNAVAINDDGVIAGEGNRQTHRDHNPLYRLSLLGVPSPLRMTASGGFDFTLLGTLGGSGLVGGPFSSPVAGSGEAVNDRGDIAGYSFTASGARHAFVWTRSGGMKDLGTLGGAESVAMGINAKGDIAGWSLDAAGNRRAVLWTKSGSAVSKSSGVSSRPSFNLAPAPAKSFEVASCPGRLGMLLEIGALDRCPVRDRQVRQ